jgi:hypothetical protein
LEPYGFYKFTHTDDDGWPHYELVEELPPINKKQKEHLMKEAMLNYFKNQEYID